MTIFPGDRRNEGLKKGAGKYGSEAKAEAEKKRLGARENGIAPDQAEPYGDAVADTAQESRENGYTKRAWVHAQDESQPQMGRISCPCGKAPLSKYGDGQDVNCPCGRKYDSRGNILAGPELQNEDSSATGFQSGQETTTAEREDDLENAEKSGKCLLCGSDMTVGESILEKKLIHFGCWQSSNFDAKLDQMGGRKKLRLENSAGFLTLSQRGSWATRGRENAGVRGGSTCPDCERGKLRLVVMKSEDGVNRYKCDVCATTFREGDEVQNSDDNTFGESATQIQNRKGKERWDAASATERLKFLLEANLSDKNGHQAQNWDQLRTGAKLALLGYGGGKSIVNAEDDGPKCPSCGHQVKWHDGPPGGCTRTVNGSQRCECTKVRREDSRFNAEPDHSREYARLREVAQQAENARQKMVWAPGFDASSEAYKKLQKAATDAFTASDSYYGKHLMGKKENADPKADQVARVKQDIADARAGLKLWVDVKGEGRKTLTKEQAAALDPATILSVTVAQGEKQNSEDHDFQIASGMWEAMDQNARAAVMKKAGVSGYGFQELDEIHTPHAKQIVKAILSGGPRQNASDGLDLDDTDISTEAKANQRAELRRSQGYRVKGVVKQGDGLWKVELLPLEQQPNYIREGARKAYKNNAVENGRACVTCEKRAENFCTKCSDPVCDECAKKAGSTLGGNAYCPKCGSPEKKNADPANFCDACDSNPCKGGDLCKGSSRENADGWLQRVAKASGVPYAEVERKWREHVRTVSNENPSTFAKEFLDWYGLKENAAPELENADSFNVHCSKCDELTKHTGVQSKTEGKRKCSQCGTESEFVGGKWEVRNATRADYAKWKAGYDALLDKMKPLTAKMHALEDQHDLAPTPRGQEPKGPPEYVAVMKQIAELERLEADMLKNRPTDITNAGPAVCAGCKKPLPNIRDQWDSYDTGKAWCRECDGTKAQNDPNAGKGGEGDRGLGPWENASDWEDKPMAAAGRGQSGAERSYRYQGTYGWIMIGAGSTQEALSEANRSLSTGKATVDKLQKWDGSKYASVRNSVENSSDCADCHHPSYRHPDQGACMSCKCLGFASAERKNSLDGPTAAHLDAWIRSQFRAEQQQAARKKILDLIATQPDLGDGSRSWDDVAKMAGVWNSGEPLENALRENTISVEQWETLGREYAKHDTIPMDRVDALLRIIHSADDEAIKQLASREIKFVSKVARNEMVRRGLKNSRPLTGKCICGHDGAKHAKPAVEGGDSKCSECACHHFKDENDGPRQIGGVGLKNTDEVKCPYCAGVKVAIGVLAEHIRKNHPGVSDPDGIAEGERQEMLRSRNNSVDLSPSWLAASLEERAAWLEQSGQDINLAGETNWNNLSEDVKVALQNEKERMVTRNNSDDDARKTWDKMVSEERHVAYRKATGLDKGGPNDFMLGAWQSLDAGERAALSKTLSNAVTDYGNRHPDFIKWVKQVASVNGKSESDVFKMWKDYSAASYDQSALTSEFMDANRLKGTDMHGRPSRAQQGLKNASPSDGWYTIEQDVATSAEAEKVATTFRGRGMEAKVKDSGRGKFDVWVKELPGKTNAAGDDEARWKAEGRAWSLKLGKADANLIKYDSRYEELPLAQQSDYIKRKFSERQNGVGYVNPRRADYTFRDAEGESVVIRADDENEAWSKLARQMNTTVPEMKAMGVKMVKEQIQNAGNDHYATKGKNGLVTTCNGRETTVVGSGASAKCGQCGSPVSDVDSSEYKDERKNAESLVRKTWYFDAMVITTGTDHSMQGQVEAFDEADAKKQVEEKALKSGAKGVRSCKVVKAYRDNAVENAVARFERPCPKCDGMAYTEDAGGNDVKCPKCKGTGVEQVSSLKNDAPLNSFTFVDNIGAEEIVEAENADEAWVGLAGRMNSTKEEMTAAGVSLKENAAAGDTFFCPKCRAVMTEYTMGVHNRANPTHSVQRLDVNGKVVGAVWAVENASPQTQAIDDHLLTCDTCKGGKNIKPSCEIGWKLVKDWFDKPKRQNADPEPLPEGQDPIGVATEKQPQIGGVIGIVPEGEENVMENADDGRAAWESFSGRGDELRQILRELGIKDAADVSYKYWKDVPADVKAKFSARQNADGHQPNPPRSKNPRICPSCNEDQEMVKQRGGVEHQPDKCPMKENAVETPAERRNAGTALGASKYGGAPVRTKIVVPERLNAEDVPCSKCGKPSGLGYTPGAGAKAVCEKCYDAEVEALTKKSEKKNADEERIIEWPQKGSGKFWLVSVNPSDGSYFPKREATREEWAKGGKKQA